MSLDDMTTFMRRVPDQSETMNAPKHYHLCRARNGCGFRQYEQRVGVIPFLPCLDGFELATSEMFSSLGH